MFNNQELLTLIAVIDKGSFESAARSLFVTTGAISQRIKSLENKFGAPIIIRSSPPKLTKNGERIMLLARQISLLQKEVVDVLSAKKEGRASVPIAVNYDSLTSWFLKVITRSCMETDILLDIKTTSKSATQQLLKDGTVIAAVTPSPEIIPGCKAVSLGALEYLPVCSRQFYQEHFKKGVSKQSLLKVPAIYFSNEDYSGNSFLKKFDLSPEDIRRYFIPETDGIIEMVKANMGWAPLPRFSLEKHSEADLICFDPHVFTIELFWKTWELSSLTIHNFSQIVLQEARSHLLQTLPDSDG